MSINTYREQRYRLLAAAQTLLPDHRIHNCMRRVSVGSEGVQIVMNDGRAHYGNLFTCGSVWVCPVCSARISAARRTELRRALTAARDQGLDVLMFTFTLSHSVSDRLSDVLCALRDAHRRMERGAPWKRITSRVGLMGRITALEVTYGSNGWHPHLHSIWFVWGGLDSSDHEKLLRSVSSRFRSMLLRVGGFGDAEHAVNLKTCSSDDDVDDISLYAVKPARLEYELTSSPKGLSRTASPFVVLDRYRCGEGGAGSLFREYAAAMHGRRQLNWSPGLRDLLLLGPEVDDESVANGDGDGLVVAVLTYEQWYVVLASLAQSYVLDLAEQGLDSLWSWLSDHGVPYTDLNARMLARVPPF